MVFPIDPSSFRLLVFAGVFAVLAVAELLAPRRVLSVEKTPRWFTNLALVVIDTVLLRIVFPVAAIEFASYIAGRGWGVFNLTSWPAWLEIISAVVLLDLAIYGQHVASHKIGIFWRLHKVHHIDRDIDVTTGIRFHPVEILLSMAYKFAIIALLGPAALAVFIFEVVLNASAMFTHANLKLPRGLDHALRMVFVTPDMHRVHHSTHLAETDSNYGFNLSVWDRLFRTYTPQPRDGHERMTIGLDGYQTREPSRLDFVLMAPVYPPREGEARRRKTSRQKLPAGK